MAENDDTRTTTRQREAGYSLIEIMIVVCMVGIISAMAVPVSSTFLVQRKADSAIVSTLAAVNAARDRAVAERRNIQLTFIPPNTIRLSRVEVPSGVLTPVQDFSLDNGQVFVKFGPVPDTPDAFGAATYASFTGTEPVMFTSDGSLLDSNGDITNGSIFVGFAGQKETARAVTIFGVTGLTRAWKWRGTKWME
jgi:prepilin-type N-terminal cleavage/methylation domain-containing protein